MKIISDICGWVAVVCFPTAAVCGLILAVDWIRRAKLPGLGKLLFVVALFGMSLMGLGGIVIFSEIAKHQQGAPGATDGVMYFVFCAAGGAILAGAAFVVWFVQLFAQKQQV